MMSCTASQNQLEMKLLQLLGGDSKIMIDDNKRLTLEAANTRLVFRLQDILMTTAVTVGIMLLVAWWPVRRLANLNPTQALRGTAIT